MKRKINETIDKIDKLPLWILGILVIMLSFLPYLILGEGSVFPIHDQLDETICSYVLSARHLFDNSNVYPEMMGGISADGMMPSAVLFILLYKIFPFFTAFLLQYFIIQVIAFSGMYGLLKRLSESSGIAFVVGVLFVFLPFKPVYGLSLMGIPFISLCFIYLYEKKHIALSILGIIFFGLTTHLILIGYVVLTYLGIIALYLLWKKKFKQHIWFFIGMIMLIFIYCIVNYHMFADLILGASDFVSHREEFVNNTENINTWSNIINIFVYGESEYAPSCHWYLLPAMALITGIQSIRMNQLCSSGKKRIKTMLILWCILIANAFLYGFLTSSPVMIWRNQQTGVFRYFQANRYYWAYPSLWWILIGIGLSLFWKDFPKLSQTIKLCIIMLIMLPTINLLKIESNLYDNLNEYHHGSAYTGMPTWQEHFMPDIMKQIDEYIAKDKSEYRVAHVGLNPSAAIVYGFYTVDGYSNNYSLEYKHSFRKVIEKELEKNPTLETYFDTWGSRCYLYSAEGNQPLKSSKFIYHDLDFNLEQLQKMGCEYIFSSGEIAGKMETLTLEGVFDTPNSIYEVWLYHIDE